MVFQTLEPFKLSRFQSLARCFEHVFDLNIKAQSILNIRKFEKFESLKTNETFTNIYRYRFSSCSAYRAKQNFNHANPLMFYTQVLGFSRGSHYVPLGPRGFPVCPQGLLWGMGIPLCSFRVEPDKARSVLFEGREKHPKRNVRSTNCSPPYKWSQIGQPLCSSRAGKSIRKHKSDQIKCACPFKRSSGGQTLCSSRAGSASENKRQANVIFRSLPSEGR